jgi:molecular chaperone GrpE
VNPDPKPERESEDGERVVVRGSDRSGHDASTPGFARGGRPAPDLGRIDPETGAVRTPEGEAATSTSGAAPAEPADSSTDDPRVAELTAEVAERTADLQRLSAEYANYRRRVDRDRETVLVNARAQFVGELLTVLDDVERAGTHGDLRGPFKSVADKLVSAVQKLGLEPFGTEGEPFDPSVHEAVQHEPSDATGSTVTVVSAVMRRGYRIGDRVLRPAMVGVVDRADDGTTSETPPEGIPVVDPVDDPEQG